jgi:hypothetical protein
MKIIIPIGINQIIILQIKINLKKASNLHFVNNNSETIEVIKKEGNNIIKNNSNKIDNISIQRIV